MIEDLPRYAGGFLFNQRKKKVLIHLRDNNTLFSPGRWSFFGGLCEMDETPLEAFLREFKEELEVTLSKESVIPLRSYVYEKLNTVRHIFYAKSELNKSSMKLHEGADFDWVSIDTIFSYNITSAARADIEFFVTQVLNKY